MGTSSKNMFTARELKVGKRYRTPTNRSKDGLAPCKTLTRKRHLANGIRYALTFDNGKRRSQFYNFNDNPVFKACQTRRQRPPQRAHWICIIVISISEWIVLWISLICRIRRIKWFETLSWLHSTRENAISHSSEHGPFLITSLIPQNITHSSIILYIEKSGFSGFIVPSGFRV